MTLPRTALLLLALGACTANVPYRFAGYEDDPDVRHYADRDNRLPPRQTCWVGVGDDGEPQHQPPPCAAVEPPPADKRAAMRVEWRYHLSVVEFDEFGDFWLRKQLDQELQCLLFKLTGGRVDPSALREELCVDRSEEGGYQPPPEAPDGDGTRSAIVTLFIHGWKHNAAPDSERRGNLASFHKVLRRMAQGEVARAARCAASGDPTCETRPREIIGAYIGWRGRSFARIPLLQEFTIFNRRAAAERVARVAASHTIHRVVNWTKEINPESRAILVGHSLGAVILENVLTRSATVEREEVPGGAPLPLDLAFLINSANEAILAEQTIDVLGPPAPRVIVEERDGGRRVEVPTIISIASPGDNAVRAYFPISQQLKALLGFSKFKPGQRSLFTHTPGFSNDNRLLSHTFDDGGPGSVRLDSLHSITPPPRIELGCRPCEPPDPAEATGPKAGIYRRRAEQLEQFPPETSSQGPFCVETVSYTDLPEMPSRDYTVEQKSRQRATNPSDTASQRWQIERRLDETLNISPYWVMRVHRDIIGSHTDIFNDDVIALFSALVSLKQGLFDAEQPACPVLSG